MSKAEELIDQYIGKGHFRHDSESASKEILALILKEYGRLVQEAAAMILQEDANFGKQVLGDTYGMSEQLRRKTDGYLHDQITRAENAAKAIREMPLP